MILNRARIEELLDKSLASMESAAGCAIYLEGSIAEGFGNAMSDVDFVILRDVAHNLPTMPTILFVDRQRVEIRSRSLRDMREMLETAARHRHASRRDLLRLKEEVLDRCQRFLHAFPVREGALLEPLKQLLPESVLREIVAKWFAVRAQESMRCAVALAALQQWSEAVSWARSAVTLGAKSWLAGLGETYLAKKWISQQIARAAAESDLGRRLLSMENLARSGLPPRDYIEKAADFLRAVGIRDCSTDPRCVSLKRHARVTTWQIGSRVHIVRRKQDIFGLSTKAERVWRSLSFGRPIPDMLQCLPFDAEASGRIIAEFHRLGLVSLRWRGSEIAARPESTLAPYSERPVLSIEGVTFPDERTPARLAPVSATGFAAAGLSLAYANLVIENAREDATGAFAAGQWRVMERACRAILRHACMAVLSANGVHPLPAVEELHRALESTEIVTPNLVARVTDLDRELRIDCRDTAQQMLDTLDELVRDIRDLTGTSLFPSCFSSPEEWQRAIDIGYDWITLGAHLDADFPLDEARDIIATGGTQPMLAGRATASRKTTAGAA